MMEDGNPNGFYLLKFDDVELVPEFIPFPFGPDAGRRMRISLDPPLQNPDGDSVNRGELQSGTKIVVNLFDGGARDRVELSLDGARFEPMRYTVRTDPFVDRVHARYRDTEDSYGRATRSSHIWEFDLPETMTPGLHLVEVTSEDEFGQHNRQGLSFEVMP